MEVDKGALPVCFLGAVSQGEIPGARGIQQTVGRRKEGGVQKTTYFKDNPVSLGLHQQQKAPTLVFCMATRPPHTPVPRNPNQRVPSPRLYRSSLAAHTGPGCSTRWPQKLRGRFPKATLDDEHCKGPHVHMDPMWKGTLPPCPLPGLLGDAKSKEKKQTIRVPGSGNLLGLFLYLQSNPTKGSPKDIKTF